MPGTLWIVAIALLAASEEGGNPFASQWRVTSVRSEAVPAEAVPQVPTVRSGEAEYDAYRSALRDALPPGRLTPPPEAVPLASRTPSGRALQSASLQTADAAEVPPASDVDPARALRGGDPRDLASGGTGDDASPAAQRESEPLRLSPRGASKKEGVARPVARGATGSLVTVAASLAIVLGLFFVVVWFTRRNLPRAAMPLSNEVVQVLGRAPLAGRQQMHLVRVGTKLLLVSVTPSGAETLTEITEPTEVEHLTALCRQQQPGSATESFREMLAQLGAERPGAPVISGAADDADPEAPYSGRTARWEDRHA